MDYFASDDGSSDGSSSLVDGLLNSVTALGQTAILATQQPQVNTTYPYRPPTGYSSGGAFSPFGVTGHGSSSGLIFLAVIAVAFLFLFKR